MDRHIELTRSLFQHEMSLKCPSIPLMMEGGMPSWTTLSFRPWNRFDEAEYERLSGISVSDLHNLRYSAGNVCNRRSFREDASYGLEDW